jgi:broad specificity phosphatase PhoE
VTAWNQAGRYQGHRDIPLGELGRLQAQLVGERLAAEAIDTCVVSDLSRARETAATILSSRPVVPTVTSALRELGFGAWEGLGSREIAPRFPAAWEAWIRDPVTSSPPDGETLQQLLDRMLWALAPAVKLPTLQGDPLDWFAYQAAGGEADDARRQTVLVVSHGGPIRVLIAHLLGLPIRAYWQFAIRPASISILELYPEGAIAEVIGETAHLRDLAAAPEPPDPGMDPDPPVPAG